MGGMDLPAMITSAHLGPTRIVELPCMSQNIDEQLKTFMEITPVSADEGA
jgi:hypothetical protein